MLNITPHEKSSITQFSQSFGVQFHLRMYQLENPLQFNKWPIVTLSNSAMKICRHNIKGTLVSFERASSDFQKGCIFKLKFAGVGDWGTMHIQMLIPGICL